MKYPEIITEEFLNNNPNCIFVFGDNTIRRGTGGAAILRYHPQALGFVTIKLPNRNGYTKEQYASILPQELEKLEKHINVHPEKVYLISRLGAGLANQHNIWEMIEPALIEFAKKFNSDRVVLLWRQKPEKIEHLVTPQPIEPTASYLMFLERMKKNTKNT